MKEIPKLLEALELKDEKRTGWQLRNIENPESVADHSWSTAFLTLIYANRENIDEDRGIRMALIHDLGEAVVGDVAHRARDVEQEISTEDKERREKEAIEGFGKVLDDQVEEYWGEYEEKETDVARFVKDMDVIEMCLQALKYEEQGRYDPEEENENFQEYDHLDEFFATAEPRLNTETGRELFQKIKQKYEKAKSGR